GGGRARRDVAGRPAAYRRTALLLRGPSHALADGRGAPGHADGDRRDRARGRRARGGPDTRRDDGGPPPGRRLRARRARKDRGAGAVIVAALALLALGLTVSLLLAPIEALGWWAGWFGEEDAPRQHVPSAA